MATAAVTPAESRDVLDGGAEAAVLEPVSAVVDTGGAAEVAEETGDEEEEEEHEQAEEGAEEDALLYEDPDAQRWMTLAKLGEQEVPNVQPGSMRLTGSFQGVATTHTHQLDLAVGLDLEMPSQVAEQAMRQLAARSRSASPYGGPRSLQDGSEAIPGFEPERRSIFASLAGFFRRDAREAQRRQASPRPSLALPDLQMSVQESVVNALSTGALLGMTAQAEDAMAADALADDERERLEAFLEDARQQEGAHQQRLAELEAQLAALAEERDQLRGELDGARRELQAQVEYSEGLQRQAELSLQNTTGLGALLAEREEEVRALEGQLQQARQEAEALSALIASERGAAAAAQARLEGSLEVARGDLDALLAELQEMESIKAANARWQAETGRLQAEVRILQMETKTLRARTLADSPVKDARVYKAADGHSPKGSNSGLQRELDQARAQVAAAQAAKAAADAEALRAQASAERLQKDRDELLARAGRLAAQQQAHEAEARQLGWELQSAQEQLGSVAAEGDGLAMELQALQSRLANEELATSEARAQHRSAQRATAEARAEVAGLRRRCDDAAAAAAAAEQRMEAVSLEAAAASTRAQAALGERDRARKELREALQGGLGELSQLREELHQARQEAARAKGIEDEAERLKRRCSGLEAAREALLEELSAARAAPGGGSSPQGSPGTSILLQDANGSCLIRSVASISTGTAHLGSGASMGLPVPSSASGGKVTTVPVPAPVPSRPGRKIGKVTHIGTTYGSSLSAPTTPAPPSPTGGVGSSFVFPTAAPTRFVPAPVVTAVAGRPVAGTTVVCPVPTQPVVHVMTPAGPVRATMTVQVLGARRIR